MAKVYFASISRPGAELLAQPLEKYFHDKSLRFDDAESNNYHSCPAYTKFFSNTYIIKAEMGFSIGTYGDRIETPDQNQEWYNTIIQAPQVISPDHSHELIQLNMSEYIFFSEEEVNITQMPAYNHSTIESVFGTYDISKWFRRIRPALYLPKDKLVEVKRGDALAYLSFDRPVELIEFEWNQELQEVENSCTHLKSFQPRMSFKNLTSLFQAKRMKAKILRSIHDQRSNT